MNDITVKRDDVKIGDVWMSVGDNSTTELLVIDEVLPTSFRVRSNIDGEKYVSHPELIEEYDLIIPAKFMHGEQVIKEDSSKPNKYQPQADDKIKHSHYHKDVSDYDTIDIYAVCKIFDVQDTSGCLQHAIKKTPCQW